MTGNKEWYSRLQEDQPSTSTAAHFEDQPSTSTTALFEDQPSSSTASHAIQQLPQEQDEHKPRQTQRHKSKKPRYSGKNIVFVLGLLELVIGTISILATVATLVIAVKTPVYTYTFYNNWAERKVYYNFRYNHNYTYASAGIWGGAFLLASGIAGIRVKFYSSLCMYKTNLTLSVIATVLMLPFLIVSSLAAWDHTSFYEEEYRILSVLVIHCVLAILAIVAGIICVIHSIYCCAGVHHHRPFQGSILYYPPRFDAQDRYQFIRLRDNQFLFVPCPTVNPEFSTDSTDTAHYA